MPKLFLLIRLAVPHRRSSRNSTLTFQHRQHRIISRQYRFCYMGPGFRPSNNIGPMSNVI